MKRRDFLAGALAFGATSCFAAQVAPQAEKSDAMPRPPMPLIDYHVHLDNSTIDDVLELSRQREVKFGIVEHAGTKENIYPTVLSNDAELKAYIAMLDGKPVYKGVQAEWTDWMGCFSKEALAGLDYVITDAMTMPDTSGKRMKLWEAKEDLGAPETFMDRYVDWHVEIMTREPIDIFVNLSWLPSGFADAYDTLWTEARMGKIIEAMVTHGIAMEISSGFEIPRLPFLRLAREAGLKFAFGTNGRYPKMGLLDYSLKMAKELDLLPEEMFVPGKNGAKAVERRSW